ncbi:hypothetical protein AB2M62_04205 [Sphingomonas sp. MMS12-HWE2-04]|uniref:hypothetical protein n=1 Tax=Sphingomonas sp. MMS12-HWE2-04 TaxID=3234199 RepID=UPI00384F78F4
MTMMTGGFSSMFRRTVQVFTAIVDAISNRPQSPIRLSSKRIRSALVATLAVSAALAPVAAQASTGCDAINSGVLNFSMTTSGTTITSSTAKGSAASYRANTARTSAQTGDGGLSPASWAPDSATFYTFDVGDVIDMTANVTGFSGTGSLSARLFEGTGGSAFTQQGFEVFTGNGSNATTISFSASASTAAVQSRAVRSGTVDGTITLAVTCTPGTPPVPALNSFTASAVAYGSTGNSINAATGTSATNSPTGWLISKTSGGTFAATAQSANSSTTNVSINSSGVVTYAAPASFRGSDTFYVRASNANGDSNVATVTVPVNNPTLSGTLAGSGTRGTALSGVAITPAGERDPILAEPRSPRVRSRRARSSTAIARSPARRRRADRSTSPPILLTARHPPSPRRPAR